MSHHDGTAPAASAADDSRLHATLACADQHFENGKTREARKAYEAVLAQQPHHARALHHMALACFRDGERSLARDYLERAVNASPGNAELWEHRGLLAALAGEYVEAEACYRRAIELTGGTASLHRNLADVLKLAERRAEACAHYAKALEFDPALHHAVRRLAMLSLEDERLDEAVTWLRRAWALGASRLADGSDLIKVLSRLARTEEADAQIAQMRATFAADARALEQLAFHLNALHRYGEAYEVATQGLALDAARAGLHHNAAYASNMGGDFARMRQHSAEAARLMPDDAHLQFNLAVSLLRDGEFEEGWRHYHWHERLPQNSTLVQLRFPEWSGEPVAGRRFLLVGEQGLGDQLQSLRYADWLQRQGAIVDIWVDEALGEVAACARGVQQVWTRLPPGQYDFWCRMFRFPERMKLTVGMLPLAMPYLSAPPAAIDRWRERLVGQANRDARTRRVGLVWAGNPDYEFDRYRSIALGALAPVLERRGVSWFSLQKGAAQCDVEALPAGVKITPLGPEIGSFTDTLAIVQSLDLVVTVDTSVAHLAGAAGVPVWILLPTCTDWRWMSGRTDTPWYPSARLFRQCELGRWDEVIGEVGEALDALPQKE
jgi:tetratricopeptide (TPR) repeat protein